MYSILVYSAYNAQFALNTFISPIRFGTFDTPEVTRVGGGGLKVKNALFGPTAYHNYFTLYWGDLSYFVT